MIILAMLLIRDRWRKLNQHYGWAEYGSAGMVLLLFGWAGAASASQYVRQATASRLEILMSSLWAGWVLMAAITGKDLSWRIALERIRVFPSPGFLKIYLSTFVLGFLSSPLFVGFCAVQYWACLRGGFRFLEVLAAGAAFLPFVASVRLSGSLCRSLLHFGKWLTPRHKWAAGLGIGILAVSTFISVLHPEIGAVHPGQLFGRLISGEARVYPLAGMALWAAALIVMDCILQRALTYSCIHPMTAGSGLSLRSGMLLPYPLWPGPVFQIGVLGWLRSRAALMLFLWGGLYSFLWTWYSKPDEVLYFFLFICMNVFFHSYLRGNLLGIDRGAAWLYYRFPVRIERALSSKNLSLSFLQGCMIAALFVAGFLRADPRITVMEWSALISYAVSAILFGETCGFFFSILYPESIDRTSQFDGGATIGNMVVSGLQFLFLILFLGVFRGVQRFFPAAFCWGLFLAAPVFLCMIRFVVLATWVHNAMWTRREVILKKLTRF
jgi:hypothetical protein